MKTLLTAAALCALLVGCGANHTSIFRSVGGNMLIDAKQRAIIKNEQNKRGDVDARVCAEPSPDVFSILAESVSASGSGETASDLKIRAQLASSLAESGADIGLRTQTIQVLRDMMYRLCERYLSGAITKMEFELQASRDQRLIVAVLSIEQLTGAVRPPRVALTSKSTVDLGRDVVELEKLIIEARQNKIELEQKLAEMQAAFDAQNGKVTKLQGEYDAALQINKDLTTKHKAAAGQVVKAKDMVKKNEEALKKAEEKLKKNPNDPKLEALVALAKEELAAAQTLQTTKEGEAAAIKTKLDDSDKDVAARRKALEDEQKKLETPAKELKAAKDALANVNERIKSLDEALARARNSVATMASGSAEIEQLTGSSSNINDKTAIALSNAVVKIVEKTFNDDEFERSCLSFMNGVSRRADRPLNIDLDTVQQLSKIGEKEEKMGRTEESSDISGIDGNLGRQRANDVVDNLYTREQRVNDHLDRILESCLESLERKFSVGLNAAALDAINRVPPENIDNLTTSDESLLQQILKDDLNKNLQRPIETPGKTEGQPAEGNPTPLPGGAEQ